MAHEINRMLLPKELTEIPKEVREYYAREIAQHLRKEAEQEMNSLFSNDAMNTQSTMTTESLQKCIEEFIKTDNRGSFPKWNHSFDDLFLKYAVGIPYGFFIKGVTA